MVLEVAFNEKREGVPLINTFVLEMRREDIKNKDHSPEGQCWAVNNCPLTATHNTLFSVRF